MKKLLTSIMVLMLSIVVSNAQEAVKFQEVISFEGLSKTDLITRTKTLIAQKFVPTADNYSEDSDIGIFVVKSLFEYAYKGKKEPAKMTFNSSGNVQYTIMFEIKDGRVRLTMTDFIHTGVNNMFNSFDLLTTAERPGKEPKWKKLTWGDVKKRAQVEFEVFTSYYINKINEQSDNNW